MDTLEKEIEKSLDRVLEFYDDKDIHVNERPKVKYIDKFYKENISRICGAYYIKKRDINTAKIVDDFIEPFKVILKKSDNYTKFRENWIKQINEENEKLIKWMGYPNEEIFLFKPVKDQINKNKNAKFVIDFILYHEVWHLIEDKAGVFESHYWIKDGTATYAQLNAMNRLPKNKEILLDFKNKDDKHDSFNEIYLPLYHIINEIKEKQNPFKEMLKIPLRNKVQKKTIIKISESLIENINI
jgi:hypothetical protein